MKTGYITHPACLRHDTGIGHPESSRRLSILDQSILESLPLENQTRISTLENMGIPEKDVPSNFLTPGEGSTSLRKQLEVVIPCSFPDLDRWIAEIHLPNYMRVLKEKVPLTGRVYLDPDTPVSPASLFAAEMAVSGVLTAIDRIMEGTLENAFCAIRPPGHHAKPDRAMGFCLYNNVAVGARYIQKKYQLKKILIIDWDVHHGNGTQDAFYDDPSVFYFSTHQFPSYPGTGRERERGTGAGEGFTFNVPLPAGSGDAALLAVFEKDLVALTQAFQPDFILVSAGFDAHRDDPLASLEVSDEGFERMTQIVQSLALTHCQGRMLSCLEGGYNLDALARSVKRHLSVLSQP